MAVTIDYGNTNVIDIPLVDWTFVSGTFYTFDTEAYRLALKVLEASETGMVFTDTHIRNAPVTVAGVTLAQSIQIIAPYTNEFQAGAYTVQLEGSNNNVWSVQDNILVQNQTQVIPTNSAGLVIVTPGIGAAAIADAVWEKDATTHTTPNSFGLAVRETHGQLDRAVHINTEALTNGNGYQQTPYDNWSDAVDDAEANGLLTLELVADATVDRQLKNFFIRGIGQPTIDLNGQDMDNTTIERCTVTGSMLGSVNAEQCALVNVQNMAGVWLTVSVAGTLTIQNNASLTISRVGPAVVGSPWTLDMDSGGASQAGIHNITGGMILENMDHADDVCHLHFSQGQVTIDSSCVLGNIVITGRVDVIDNSAGSTVVVIPDSSLVNAIWDKDISGYTTDGKAGYELQIARLQAALGAALSA
jgi:hypothetical protein